uniref:G protein-coupled receptor kinase n=1 Tax=Lotharella globosa TaxID=91324 RepID=A0A7S3ZI58_9EUKA
MSFFDAVETTVANTRLLQALENPEPVKLQLKSPEELEEYADRIRLVLSFDALYKDVLGHYFFVKHLKSHKADYKADFVDKVNKFRELYRPRRDKAETLLENLKMVAQKHAESKSEDGGKVDKDRSAESASKLFEIQTIESQINAGEIKSPMFDEACKQVYATMERYYDTFLVSKEYMEYIQIRDYSKKKVTLDDFRIFRPLGRGAFGLVSVVQKTDTHAVYAMKEIIKKKIKKLRSEWMCINEMRVLAKMRSPFVLNLKYSFHSNKALYMVFDMCDGGDLKYHLRSGAFSKERARFYAAEVLLGLEHIHSWDICYRDLKPENILLTNTGHVKISDLGLAVKLPKSKDKVLKHLAGTPGYWAPELLAKVGTFKQSDYWSFGVLVFQMLVGRRVPNPLDDRGRSGRSSRKKKTPEPDEKWSPFARGSCEAAAKQDPEMKNIVVTIKYPAFFDDVTVDLLKKLFTVDYKHRLGAGSAEEIKKHKYFGSICWPEMMRMQVKPPFVPENHVIHAQTIAEVGEFDSADLKKIKYGIEDDKKYYKDFAYVNREAFYEEVSICICAPCHVETENRAGGVEKQERRGRRVRGQSEEYAQRAHRKCFTGCRRF